jgi:hypothetical protein
MALEPCPECTNPVSTTARQCPRCGYEFRNREAPPQRGQQTSTKLGQEAVEQRAFRKEAWRSSVQIGCLPVLVLLVLLTYQFGADFFAKVLFPAIALGFLLPVIIYWRRMTRWQAARRALDRADPLALVEATPEGSRFRQLLAESEAKAAANKKRASAENRIGLAIIAALFVGFVLLYVVFGH